METTTKPNIQTDTTSGTQTLEKLNEELSPQDKQAIEKIKSQIDVSDANLTVQYGVSAQSNISEFSENVLSNIRSKDSGHAGELLTDLILNVKGLDVDSLTGSGFLSKIPFLGSLVNSVAKFIKQYETLDVSIDQITEKLHSARIELLKDVTLFDNLYKKNLEYFHNLNLFILAGGDKLKEINEKVLVEMRAKAETSSQQLDTQKYQDMVQMANRFEKRLHDLKLSKTLALQTGPQIRLIQSNSQQLVEKIQSSILNTIPIWKNQIVITIGLFRQKKALKLQQEVTKATNELLTKNSELLKTNTIEVAKESEKGIIEIETLKKINHDLISTIEEVLAIQKEGKVKRQQAEVELKQIESEIKTKILEVTK